MGRWYIYIYFLVQLACSIHINQMFQHAIGIIDPKGVEWDDKICQNICFFFWGALIEILVRGFNLFEKIAHQIGSFPHVSGWKHKIFETTTQWSISFGHKQIGGERHSQACGCGLAKEKSLLPPLFLTMQKRFHRSQCIDSNLTSARHLVKEPSKAPKSNSKSHWKVTKGPNEKGSSSFAIIFQGQTRC